MASRPLAGRHIVTTRDHRGRLDSRLAEAGGDVIHVPLIEIGPPDDRGAALRSALADLDVVDWVVVTSRHGAERVGAALADRADVSVAAVGAQTAAVLVELAGRPADVVPERQTGAALVASMPPGSGRVLVAQADRADDLVAAGLRQLGYDVRVVTAYRTNLRVPTTRERTAVLAADAVVFASGSAATAWVQAIGAAGPPIVIAIGPSTAAAAESAGLPVTHVAADHDVEGLVAATIAAFEPAARSVTHRRPMVRH